MIVPQFLQNGWQRKRRGEEGAGYERPFSPPSPSGVLVCLSEESILEKISCFALEFPLVVRVRAAGEGTTFKSKAHFHGR